MATETATHTVEAEPRRFRVVVVGAGFGGLSAVAALRRAPVDITVVDRHNYHLFQPLLYQVATAALSPADIAGPVRAILRDQKNARVLMDEVTGVDPDARLVRTASGADLPYDVLVLATGARHGYFGRDDWAFDAPGIKTIDDATLVRRRILTAFERAETASDKPERDRLLTFVVVGGGPTGVEMAGAIAELARKSIIGDFRTITPHCARVLLIEAGERILPGFPPDLSEAATKALAKLGVEVRTAAKVEDVEGRGVTVNGAFLPCGTTVWAAGVKASPAGEWLNVPTDRAGRVTVEPDFSVPGRPEIFVVGDTAFYPAVGNGRGLPGIAPAAKQAGRWVGRLIESRARVRPPPPPFRYRDWGSLATIGRNNAVAAMGSLRLTGFPAWLIWSVAHVYFLIGFRNRFAVAVNWLWSYLTFERGARLITGGAVEPRGTPEEAM